MINPQNNNVGHKCFETTHTINITVAVECVSLGFLSFYPCTRLSILPPTYCHNCRGDKAAVLLVVWSWCRICEGSKRKKSPPVYNECVINS